MNNVESVLFSLVRHQLFGDGDSAGVAREATSVPIGELFGLARHHDLSHLVGAALDSAGLLGEDDTSRIIRKAQMAAIYRYRGMDYELHSVRELFTKEGIKHIPLKGAVIRGYYPEPWMRTSCDIDILIHREDLDRAVALLTERLEYKLTSRCFHDVAFYSPGGVHLELHFDLIEEFYFPRIEKILSEVWEYSIPKQDGFEHLMRDDFFYLYHIAHMLKHFVSGGCGIRFFADLYMLDTRVECDRDAREALLESAGILEFARRASKLARIWFAGEESDEFYSDFASFVIAGGVYGTTETKVMVQQKRKGGRLGYAMRRIFLPYKTLREIFPILKRHKWLTPAFEVVRWFRLVFGGRLTSSLQELRSNATLSEADAKRAEDMMRGLGLSE